MNRCQAVARPGTVPGVTDRWYRTLFLTDMAERFGFYGMQAILVLYAVAPPGRGGLGLPAVDAAALFGAWIGLAFMFSMPGGWAGDRVLGPRRAVLAGGVVIASGHLSLAAPAGAWTGACTALGLILLALGTGLYKPNHQAMINMMFGPDSGRRESGISLMYVGIQVSALLAPLITGYLGERVDWHLGFAVTVLTLAGAGLLTVYLMHACGELIVAAVSISAAADVLPPAFLGQTLGLLWLFAALGGGLGSQVVRLTQVLALSTYFQVYGLAITAAGLVFACRRHAIAGALAAPADDRSSERGEVWTRD